MPHDKQQFILTLRPEGNCTSAEAYRRLKMALKCLLRSFRLRCTSVVTDQGTATNKPESPAMHAKVANRENGSQTSDEPEGPINKS